MAKLVLRELTDGDEEAFFKGLAEWPESEREWYTFVWKPGMSYAEMLGLVRNERDGVNLAEGRVPATMYYAFVDGEIVGRLNFRHRLNDALLQHGGHVGYAVAAKYRGRGYASEILKQGIELVTRAGVSDILVTCSDDNAISARIIEKHGGVLENKIWDEKDKTWVRRYWIKSGRPASGGVQYSKA